jgi:hypothetical protein
MAAKPTIADGSTRLPTGCWSCLAQAETQATFFVVDPGDERSE